MKVITIRLPDVEAAMLEELQKANKDFRELGVVLAKVLRAAHSDMRKKKSRF